VALRFSFRCHYLSLIGQVEKDPYAGILTCGNKGSLAVVLFDNPPGEAAEIQICTTQYTTIA